MARHQSDSSSPAAATRRDLRRQGSLRRQLPGVVLLALGTVLSLFAFTAAQRAALAPIQEEFQRTAVHLTGAVRYAFEENEHALRALGALYASSQEVTRDEFHAFTGVLLREHPGIRALSWVPRVAAAERARFEAAAAAERPGFVITVRGPDGELRPAPSGREVFPVLFLEPLTGNEPALGFDISSESARRTTLEQAAGSGELLATPRLHLVQENGVGYGILLVLPVYRAGFVAGSESERRAALEGILTEVVSLSRTLDLAVRDYTAQRTELALCDLSAAEGERFLWARTAAGTASEILCDSGRQSPDSVVSTLDVGGRRWSLYIGSGPLTVTLERTWPAWMVLAFGLILTILLVTHLHEGRLHALALVEANRALNQEVGERRATEHRLQVANRELERLSREDPLMGVANRRRVDEYLAQEWQRAARSGSSLALILTDVDHFKPFNDGYGHLEGDECLRRVAQAAAGVLSRPADLIGRFGGDELAVVLPETDIRGALEVARRIHDAVTALEIPHAFSPSGPRVSLSAGVGATVPRADGSLLAFIRSVDSALYAAKEEGRARVVAAPPAPNESAT